MKKVLAILAQHALTGKWTIADTGTCAAIVAVPLGFVAIRCLP